MLLLTNACQEALQATKSSGQSESYEMEAEIHDDIISNQTSLSFSQFLSAQHTQKHGLTWGKFGTYKAALPTAC